ncbi:ATP-binding protein [Micromonospora sp. 15K316]|uniref:ATP-binding protein n=1 Tax=Micromonospora sp. 15K316 TaxID=2530376 RepID=UPI00104E8C11|nr:ATP-binding protein [Micromonospora sp. 15K316]TDC30083.1 ATP-binding protein [Micromonospora sp. 15K316]
MGEPVNDPRNPDPGPVHIADATAAAGITPAGPKPPTPIEPEPFDPVAFRVQQAAATLAARIPPRFRLATADHPQVAAWASRFLTDRHDCPSLVLVGPTGTGKTHLCWAAVRQVVEGAAARGEGLTWEATTHPDLNAALRPNPTGSHVGVLERFQRADLVFLDDLGAGKQTEWTGDGLHRLVDYRWSHQLPTIYSANAVGDPLVAAVGDRVASRLGDAMKVALVGVDRRWNRRAS